MKYVLFIGIVLCAMFIGYGIASIRRLKKVGKLLKEVSVEEPNAMAKLSILHEFNYFI